MYEKKMKICMNFYWVLVEIHIKVKLNLVDEVGEGNATVENSALFKKRYRERSGFD